jgi:hypothetical protein
MLIGVHATAKNQRPEINQAYDAAYAAGESQMDCSKAIGQRLADVLVQYCMTHSAQNALCDRGNSCRVIIDAIRTNCQAAPIPCYDPY